MPLTHICFSWIHCHQANSINTYSDCKKLTFIPFYYFMRMHSPTNLCDRSLHVHKFPKKSHPSSVKQKRKKRTQRLKPKIINLVYLLLIRHGFDIVFISLALEMHTNDENVFWHLQCLLCALHTGIVKNSEAI